MDEPSSMFDHLTPEQRERARVVCEVFGVTLEELEALDRSDGYSRARREADEREAEFRRRLPGRLKQAADAATARARAEFGLPDDMHFVWGDVDGRA